MARHTGWGFPYGRALRNVGSTSSTSPPLRTAPVYSMDSSRTGTTSLAYLRATGTGRHGTASYCFTPMRPRPISTFAKIRRLLVTPASGLAMPCQRRRWLMTVLRSGQASSFPPVMTTPLQVLAASQGLSGLKRRASSPERTRRAPGSTRRRWVYWPRRLPEVFRSLATG